MKKLSIAKRFLLSIVVFTIPIVALLVSLYQAATESIEFTESEIRGVSLLQTLNQFESEYLQVLGENILSTQAPGEKLREADKRLKNLFDQAQTEESLKERVLNLWGEILRADLSKPETFKSIQAFKASLDDLRVEIGNKNLLILDPEIDSYYTMDLIIFNIPAIQAHLLRIAVAISNASTLDQQKYMGKIISSVDRVSEITSEANDKIRMIVEEDAKHAHSSGSFKAKRENLETQYSNLSKDLNGYWDSLDLTSVDVRVASYKRLLAIYNNSISIQKILLEELNHFLEERIGDEVGSRRNKLILSLGSLLLAILLSAYIGKTISVTINTFNSAVEDLKQDAQDSYEVGKSLILASGKVSQSSTEQAAAIEETSASLEELTSMVSNNAQSSKEANKVAEVAKESAYVGEKEMQALIISMNQISESSKKIGEIMQIIDDIAFQTNLLALNASVEAARAGEHGKGFAVVAEAVRQLAQRSATSAKEISALITDSLSKIEQGKHGADKSGEAIGNIRVSIEKLAALNAEIATASNEQSAGLTQISKAIHDLEKGTIENSGVAQQASEYSKKALTQAEELMRLVHVLEAELKGKTKRGDGFSFEDAINAHLKWKMRLMAFVDGSSQEKLESQKICQDDQCQLGKWIYGHGKKYSSDQIFQKMRDEHAHFHQAAGEIVAAVEDGQQKTAYRLLSDDGRFERHTKAVVSYLKELDKKIS